MAMVIVISDVLENRSRRAVVVTNVTSLKSASSEFNDDVKVFSE